MRLVGRCRVVRSPIQDPIVGGSLDFKTRHACGVQLHFCRRGQEQSVDPGWGWPDGVTAVPSVVASSKRLQGRVPRVCTTARRGTGGLGRAHEPHPACPHQTNGGFAAGETLVRARSRAGSGGSIGHAFRWGRTVHALSPSDSDPLFRLVSYGETGESRDQGWFRGSIGSDSGARP